MLGEGVDGSNYLLWNPSMQTSTNWPFLQGACPLQAGSGHPKWYKNGPRCVAILAQVIHICWKINARLLAMSLTGTVKKLMEDKGFGFITPDDGGEDVFIHIKQCNGAESLSEGDKVTYDNQWNDRKGKMQGDNCTVTESGGGGGGGGGYGGGKGGKDSGKGKGKSWGAQW